MGVKKLYIGGENEEWEIPVTPLPKVRKHNTAQWTFAQQSNIVQQASCLTLTVASLLCRQRWIPCKVLSMIWTTDVVTC